MDIMNTIERAWQRFEDFKEVWLYAPIKQAFIDVGDFDTPTLEDTIVEKIGGGPHGYGDPEDKTIREEEHYLFPRMVWKKVRYEKCFNVVEKYYECALKNAVEQEDKCKKEESAMFRCKAEYYSERNIAKIEEECVQEYLALRTEFRKTASEEVLLKIKMLMLAPGSEKMLTTVASDRFYAAIRERLWKDDAKS